MNLSENSLAFRNGYNSYQLEGYFGDNPYEKDSEEYEEWTRGWNEGYMEEHDGE